MLPLNFCRILFRLVCKMLFERVSAICQKKQQSFFLIQCKIKLRHRFSPFRFLWFGFYIIPKV